LAIYRFVEPRLGRRRLIEWRRRALRVFALLAAVIAGCALGLALLDDPGRPFGHRLLMGLWNAVNLVTTLGDFSDFDPRQRLFMLGTMMAVFMIGGYAIGQLTGILSSPDVLAYRENRQMERKLKDLSGHAVVIGYVGLGRLLSARLRDAGQQVVVIDREPASAALASDLGFLVIEGDAGADDGVLRSARIDTARVLLVTTGDTQRNLILTVAARSLNAGLRIVVSGPDEHWGEMLRRSGASDVVITDQLLAEAMLGRLGAPES